MNVCAFANEFIARPVVETTFFARGRGLKLPYAFRNSKKLGLGSFSKLYRLHAIFVIACKILFFFKSDPVAPNKSLSKKLVAIILKKIFCRFKILVYEMMHFFFTFLRLTAKFEGGSGQSAKENLLIGY